MESMNFENIQSLDDIDAIISNINNPDGEDTRFELKGSSGETTINKTSKKLLSKEISAFANTYGGIVCFHFGQDKKLKKFPSEKTNVIFTSLEGWLKDSLKPLLLGIEVKVVDDIFLINIPESQAKPHMANDSKYYYRHSTSSTPMPEIMISSLYRSQDFLEFDLGASFQKMGSQLATVIWVNNKSRIAGTKPRLKITIAKSDGKHFEFQTNNAIRYRGFSELLKKPQMVAPSVVTTHKFAEEILYPEDSISVGVNSKVLENLSQSNLFLLEVECSFLQRSSKSIHRVFEFNGDELISTHKFDSFISSRMYFIAKLNEVKPL